MSREVIKKIKICFMYLFLRISVWALIPKLTLDEWRLGDEGEALNRGGAYSNIDRKDIFIYIYNLLADMKQKIHD